MSFNWRSALLFQARSDFKMLQLLNQSKSVELCHRLHYLQMMTEKLAKSHLAVGALPPKPTHKALSTFLRHAKSRRDLQVMCGFSNRKSQYHAYVDSLKTLAKSIEDLAPSGQVQSPNPEYPWEERRSDSSDRPMMVIQAPANYSFHSLDMNSPQMIKIMKFIETCLKWENR